MFSELSTKEIQEMMGRIQEVDEAYGRTRKRPHEHFSASLSVLLSKEAESKFPRSTRQTTPCLRSLAPWPTPEPSPPLLRPGPSERTRPPSAKAPSPPNPTEPTRASHHSKKLSILSPETIVNPSNSPSHALSPVQRSMKPSNGPGSCASGTHASRTLLNWMGCIPG